MLRQNAAMPADWFDAAYEGTPPWDIGRPQPEIVRLQESGHITGAVLDVGCGTGEHVLLLAERGYDVMGIDGSPRAIEKALSKARQRRLDARLEVADALDLAALKRRFDTVIDSGLFHIFPDDERLRFVKSLGGVVPPGGAYFMMCFSEHEPGNWGPRRVTQAEIRAAFRDGWRVDSITSSIFETLGEPAKAWLASLTRTKPGD
jgi:SAM-dependent methyltransferase